MRLSILRSYGVNFVISLLAAGAADFTQLRRHLRRFEALTSAIWAVQDVSR